MVNSSATVTPTSKTMPFKSKAQQRWMFANDPEMAKEWADETPDFDKLPEKVAKKKKKKDESVMDKFKKYLIEKIAKFEKGDLVVLLPNVKGYDAEDLAMDDDEYAKLCKHVGKQAKIIDIETDDYYHIKFTDGFEVENISGYHFKDDNDKSNKSVTSKKLQAWPHIED